MSAGVVRERLAETFVHLCEISSPSRREKAIASYLKELFTALGADSIEEDASQGGTGSDSGNLIIRFLGTAPGQEGIFFSCHMDTVQPGEGVTVVRTGDVFTSKGDTILGGDDKSGIAAVIEAIRMLRENNSPHPDLEILITTCEEIGLLGAKFLDFSKVRSRYGYALDSSGLDRVIIGAPAANKFTITITGIAAHAGLHPEKGISAIEVAARAISSLRLGRLDEESTANLGLINGGVATNIVPDSVSIDGEVRSHNTAKLQRYTEEIVAAFEKTANSWPQARDENGERRPAVQIAIKAEYPAMRLTPDSPVVRRIDLAGRTLGKQLDFTIAGGGSDANIFNSHGLPTAIVATGMDQVHTVNERLNLNDLTELTRLVYAIATIDDRSTR